VAARGGMRIGGRCVLSLVRAAVQVLAVFLRQSAAAPRCVPLSPQQLGPLAKIRSLLTAKLSFLAGRKAWSAEDAAEFWTGEVHSIPGLFWITASGAALLNRRRGRPDIF